MEVKGTIKRIGKEESYGSNGFVKRNLVIETDEKYPQTLLIEFHKDRTGLLDHVTEGETVDVAINLRGREWTNPKGETKVFNTIVGWKIGTSDSQEAAPSMDETDDDIPF